MNLSSAQLRGGLLLVPQFTLAADTVQEARAQASARPQNRPARVNCSPYLLEQAQSASAPVSAGVFGADMQVALVNDGPVTLAVHLGWGSA